MRITTVSIQRPEGAAAIATGIPIQIDQTSDVERFQYQQAYNIMGADVWKVFSLIWGLDTTHRLQRGDVLTDERYTDPETGNAYVYRVVSRPRDYDGDHQECVVQSIVGG